MNKLATSGGDASVAVENLASDALPQIAEPPQTPGVAAAVVQAAEATDSRSSDLKLASLSAKPKMPGKKQLGDDERDQLDEPVQLAEAPPQEPANSSSEPGEPAEPQPESEGDSTDEQDGGSNELLIAGGVLGLGLIGAAVAAGGGGGGSGGSAPTNQKPVAQPDTATATEGGPVVAGSVAANDSDPDGDTLSYSLSSPVAGLTLNSDGTYSFDPSDPAYDGLAGGTTQTVVANYTVSDGKGGSASSTLTITVTGVNDAPVATADSYTTAEDTPLVIPSPGVLANDSDVDGDSLSAILVTGPTNGTLTLNADGSFTYTPNANYSGPDSFTYKVNDGTTDGNTVTVSLTVTAVNDAPVGGADAYSTDEDTPLVIAAPGVLANDTDVEGDALTAVLVTGPEHGTLTLNADGSFTYTPDADYNGPDSFTYRPNDGTSDGAPVTVSLTVNPVNDAPVATADNYSTDEDTPLVIAAPGVLANDSDVDGDTLSSVLVSDVSNGTLSLNADGSFTYTPNANYNGPDSFTYKVNDGTVDGNTVTVNITINPVNDAPVAAPDTNTAVEDGPVVTGSVATNDSDIEGDTLSFALVAPVPGLTLNTDGSYSFDPSDAAYQDIASGETRDVVANYTVSDGQGGTASSTLTITVTGVNDAPTLTDFGPSVTFSEDVVNAAPQLLDFDVVFEDPDDNFDGGTLILSARTPGNELAEDRFGINNQGTGAGQIGVSGSDVTYGGVVIGTFSGGVGAALVVTFNANATSEAIDALIQNLTYANVSDTPTPTRDLVLNVTDSDGADLGFVVGGFTQLEGAANPFNGLGSAQLSFLVAPAFVDYDNDGDMDLVTGGDDGQLRTFRNNGDGTFTQQTGVSNPFNGFDIGQGAGVAFADIDGDGDEDALVTEGLDGFAVWLRNNGDGTFSNMGVASGIVRGDGIVESNARPAFYDIDGDGLKDAVIGAKDGLLLAFRNNGDGTFTQMGTHPFTGINFGDGSYTSPTFGDFDGDGDEDLIVGLSNGFVEYFENNGGVFTHVADPSSPFWDIFVGQNASPAFGDIDGDGDLDVVVGSTDIPLQGRLDTILNEGFRGQPIEVHVTSESDAPVGGADAYSTDEDTPLVIAAPGVLANDTDVEGDALTAVLVTGPEHGTLTLNADGSFTYTPDADYNGPDSFTYRPNDGTSDGAPVTVSLTVNPVNDAPVATADNYSTDEDTPLVIAAPGVLANDSDVDGDTLSSVLVSDVSNGTLSLNADGSFTYTPNANYNGPDSFTYKVNDGTVDGNTVTVNITINPVNDAPVATPDAYSASTDATLVVAAGSGVLANDTDVDGDTLSAILVSDVSNGTLTLNADGSFNYTPDSGYSGPDSFTYKVNDGTVDGNTVTVSLSVSPNDPPAATADAYSTGEDTVLSVPAASGVLANDSDPDGDPLNAILVSDVSNGTLVLNPDGSFTYTPDPDFNGTDSFTYKVNDGIADGNTVTVDLTVNAVNDAPLAAADAYSVDEDETLNVAAPGVLANDSDVEGDSLTAVLVSDVSNGTLTLNADGSFSYTPDADFSGTDSFTYRANDGTVDGNTVTVTLTVNPVNDAPVATADNYATDEDTPLVIPAPGVLTNDTDIDGDSLSSILVSDVSNGTLSLNADGSFTYTPDADFNGSDSFTYKVNDGTVDGNTVTVNLTVNPANDAPVANDDAGTANEDTGLTVDAASGVLSNDLDIDGDTLSVSEVNGVAANVGTQFTLPSGALLTVNADGSYTYDTNGQFEALRPGETDTDSFTYTVSDGNGGTDTATVTLTIEGANEVPTAADDAYDAIGNVTLNVAAGTGVLANDSDDVAGFTVTAFDATSANGGTVSVNADGSFSYTSAPGFSGTDTFTYTITDSDGATDTATVTVTVADPVWFIDNSAIASANLGTQADPFTSIAAFNAAQGTGNGPAAGETIYLRQGTGTYSEADGINLLNGQTLIGGGENLVVNSVTIETGTGTPTIVTTGGTNHGVELAQNNSLSGFNIGNTTGAGISDGNGTVGTLTVSNVSITGSGQILDIDQGGTLNVTLNSAASSSSTGGAIDLNGVQGSFTVTGATSISGGSHTGGGVDVTSASGAFAVNFTGGLTINSGTGFGLNFVSGGTLTIGGAGNSISTTTGQVLNISNATLGSDVTFASLTATGTVANTAISFNNLDGNAFNGGTVSIAGTSGAASDGIFIGGGSTTNFSFAGATIGGASSIGDEGIEINGAGNGTVTFTTVNINNTAGHGVEINGATNSVSINGGTIGNTNDPAGDGVNVTGGTGAVSIAAAITKTSAGNVVEINNHDAGNVTFSGNLSATGGVNNGILVTGSNGGTIAFTGQTINISTGANAGVTLTSNTGGTINFAPLAGGNGLDIVTTSGAGFTATGGGTVSVTGSGNTISSGTGAALNFENTLIGSSGLTFQSISANGGSKGIYLNNTGTAVSNGGLTVTGTGSAGSGGTIQNIAGSGVEITSAKSISLSWMNLTNANTVNGVTANDNVSNARGAIDLLNVTGFSMNQVVISGAEQHGIVGSNVTNFSMSNSTVQNAGNAAAEHGIIFVGLFGTASITNSTITGSAEANFRALNTSGTLGMTFSGNTVSNNSAIGGDGFLFDAQSNATVILNIQNNTFTANRDDHINVTAANAAVVDVTIKSNTLTGGHANPTGQGIAVRAGGTYSGTLTFDIDGNSVNGAIPTAINVGLGSSTSSGLVQGFIRNNTIGTSGVTLSGSQQGSGILAEANGTGTGTVTVSITNNTIRQAFDMGIYVLGSRDGSNNLNATITGNNVNELTDPSSRFAIRLETGSSLGTETGTVKAEISGNTLNAANTEEISIRKRSNATVQLLNYAGPVNNDAAVVTYLQAQNPAGGTAVVTHTNAANFTGTASVPQPSAPVLPPAPLLASTIGTAGLEAALLTQVELDAIVEAAIQRWAEAGATAAQLEAMRAVQFSVSDLGGLYLASTDQNAIMIDDDAAGHGWFVDTTPLEDSEFAGNGTELTAIEGGAAEGKMDLITVVMHELGHQIGLEDSYASADSAGLMYGYLDPGERQLPELETATALASDEGGSASLQGWIESALPDFAAAKEVPAKVQGWLESALPGLDFGRDSVDGLLAALGVPQGGAGATGSIRHAFSNAFEFSHSFEMPIDLASKVDLIQGLDDRVL